MDELSDLINAARQGDERAFARIVERFQDMAYATAYGLTGDFHLAQDVAQEAFVDAYLHLHQLREPAAFPGWFRRILLKHGDRQTRGKRPTLLSMEAANSLPARTPDPALAVQDAELRRSVHAAIQVLPEKLRTVVALFYGAGYAQKEIADVLDVPVSTIKKRLYDARSQLKRRMLHMVQEQLHATKPSQTDEFADQIQFFIALKTHDLRQIKRLVEKHPHLLHVRTEWPVGSEGHFWPLGATALHWAAATGDRALLIYLLDAGADVDAKDRGGWTPLHYAAQMQPPDVIQRLLDAGAQIDAVQGNGQTALHIAALRGRIEVVELLLANGANVNMQDNQKRTAADWAALAGRTDVVDLLLANGAATPTAAAPTTPEPATRGHTMRTVPVGEGVLGRILDPQGQPKDHGSLKDVEQRPIYRPADQMNAPLLETGIKVIDLCSPLVRGGHNGLFTPMSGVGRVVLTSQIINSVARRLNGRIVYLGLEQGVWTAEGLRLAWRAEHGVDEEALERQVALVFGNADDAAGLRRQVVETGLTIGEAFRRQGHEVLLVVESKLALTEGVVTYLRANAAATPDAAITVLYVGDPSVGAEPEPLMDLDAVIAFSRERAQQGLWPAVDPIASHSKLLDHPLLDPEHRQVVARMKRYLRRYEGLHSQVESAGLDALFHLDNREEDERVVIRARRIQRFLTQPFPGLEVYTGRLGVYVPLEEAIQGCRAILDGEYDEVPEAPFYFTGTLAQAEAVLKAQT